MRESRPGRHGWWCGGGCDQSFTSCGGIDDDVVNVPDHPLPHGHQQRERCRSDDDTVPLSDQHANPLVAHAFSDGCNIRAGCGRGELPDEAMQPRSDLLRLVSAQDADANGHGHTVTTG